MDNQLLKIAYIKEGDDVLISIKFWSDVAITVRKFLTAINNPFVVLNGKEKEGTCLPSTMVIDMFTLLKWNDFRLKELKDILFTTGLDHDEYGLDEIVVRISHKELEEITSKEDIWQAIRHIYNEVEFDDEL